MCQIGRVNSKEQMNATNNSIETNIKSLIGKHGLSVKSRKTASAFSDYVTVNESGAEFLVSALDVMVHHPRGGWMDVSGFTTREILDL